MELKQTIEEMVASANQYKPMPTCEEIAEATDHLDGSANIRAINKIFRAWDQSDLFPINGRFNATERAISRVSRAARCNGSVMGLEYCYALDGEISLIVNDPKLL